MKPPMTEARLVELIETWGAEPSCWPEAEREVAMAMLAAASDRFEEALSQARELDLMLEGLPQPEVSRTLADAIVAAAPRPKAARNAGAGWFGLRTPWAPASGFGFAAAALGLFMGLTVAPAASADDEMNAEVQELVISALGFDTARYDVENLE